MRRSGRRRERGSIVAGSVGAGLWGIVVVVVFGIGDGGNICQGMHGPSAAAFEVVDRTLLFV